MDLAALVQVGPLLIASMHKKGAFLVLMNELLTVAEWLELVVEIGALIIVLESDSKTVIDFITSGDQCLNEFESILLDIQGLSRDIVMFL